MPHLQVNSVRPGSKLFVITFVGDPMNLSELLGTWPEAALLPCFLQRLIVEKVLPSTQMTVGAALPFATAAGLPAVSAGLATTTRVADRTQTWERGIHRLARRLMLFNQGFFAARLGRVAIAGAALTRLNGSTVLNHHSGAICHRFFRFELCHQKVSEVLVVTVEVAAWREASARGTPMPLLLLHGIIVFLIML